MTPMILPIKHYPSQKPTNILEFSLIHISKPHYNWSSIRNFMWIKRSDHTSPILSPTHIYMQSFFLGCSTVSQFGPSPQRESLNSYQDYTIKLIRSMETVPLGLTTAQHFHIAMSWLFRTTGLISKTITLLTTLTVLFPRHDTRQERITSSISPAVIPVLAYKNNYGQRWFFQTYTKIWNKSPYLHYSNNLYFTFQTGI